MDLNTIKTKSMIKLTYLIAIQYFHCTNTWYLFVSVKIVIVNMGFLNDRLNKIENLCYLRKLFYNT